MLNFYICHTGYVALEKYFQIEKYYSSEIDDNAITVSKANCDDKIYENIGDMKKITE